MMMTCLFFYFLIELGLPIANLNRLGHLAPLWKWYWWFCFLCWLDWDYQQVDRQHQGWLLRGREILCYSEASRFVSTFLSQHCTEEPGDKSKTSNHQLKNSTQYLISGVGSIEATGDNHLLVQVSSFKRSHRPGTNLLCSESWSLCILSLKNYYNNDSCNDEFKWFNKYFHLGRFSPVLHPPFENVSVLAVFTPSPL